MSTRPIYHVIEHQNILTAVRSTTVSEASAMMKQYQVGAILILEHHYLLGIFTERDALFKVLAEGLNPKTTTLNEVMTIHPQTISPDKPLSHALHMMYEGGFRHVPVVENNHVVGMVSSRDALGSELINFESELDQREHIAEILG